MTGNDKIEFKITKDENDKAVDLNALSIKAAEAFSVMLQGAINILHLSAKQPSFTISIRKGSAMIVAEGNHKQVGQVRKDFEAIIDRKSSNKKLVKEWRSLQELFQKNGLTYELNFYRNNKKEELISVLKQSKKFRTKKVFIKAYTNIEFITGRLIEVGGKSPNIHVDDREGRKLTINCTEKNAKKANNFLYDSIYISVWTKEKGDDTYYELCDSYFEKDLEYYRRFEGFINRYKDLPIVTGLKELHYECRSYLDERNYGYLRKFLRLFIHKSTDVNILKTILILLQPFEDHEKLSVIYSQIQGQFDHNLNAILKNKK